MSIRKILGAVVTAALVFLSGAIAQQTQQKKKTTSASKKTAPAARKKGVTTTTKKKGTTTAARSGKKGTTKRPATTWRNRQTVPGPERYREIQNALAARGYLSGADATGVWNQSSIDALKKFQAAQNLEPSGKINSLSLIALGLGPKRDATPVTPAAR